jgi:hypothetical protein
MAKRSQDQLAGDITRGAIPMKDSSGRKYKVRIPNTHDFESVPSITGIVVAFGEHDVKGERRAFVVLDSGESISRVYESKALEELFKSGDVGDHVKLTYSGEKDLGGGKSYKKISVEVWTE